MLKTYTVNMLTFLLAFIFWFNLVKGAANIDWTLNDKLITLKNSLIYTKSLQNFANVTHSDNYPRFDFQEDANKVKRSYDNDRCINDLKWIQENINNPQNPWAFECKFKTV